MYLEVNDLCKSYGEGGSYTQVLKNVSLEVQQGDMCVIQGTSGSGKSTLLNCIGGLDTVDSGSIVVDGKEIVGLNAKQLSDYRREELGFIFQFYDLVPDLTVQENIQVCQYLTRSPLDLGELLQVLGLTEHRTSSRPSFRAASSSAAPSPGPSSKIRACCCATSPPVRWTARPRGRSSPCWSG